MTLRRPQRIALWLVSTGLVACDLSTDPQLTASEAEVLARIDSARVLFSHFAGVLGGDDAIGGVVRGGTYIAFQDHPWDAALGQGFTYSAYSATIGAYELDAQAVGVPSDAVRFHLYEIDESTGRPKVPLDGAGYLDLRRVPGVADTTITVEIHDDVEGPLDPYAVAFFANADSTNTSTSLSIADGSAQLEIETASKSFPTARVTRRYLRARSDRRGAIEARYTTFEASLDHDDFGRVRIALPPLGATQDSAIVTLLWDDYAGCGGVDRIELDSITWEGSDFDEEVEPLASSLAALAGEMCPLSDVHKKAAVGLLAPALTARLAVAPVSQGTIRVANSTTGWAPDPDGYVVTIPDGRWRRVTANDTATFAPVRAQRLTLGVYDVASTCSNPYASSGIRNVTVPAGGVADVPFTISCDPPRPGFLRVDVHTTGTQLDPDGYLVAVDSMRASPRSMSIGREGSVTFEVLEGDREVDLRKVAGNCFVVGSDRRRITVIELSTVVAEFEVSCGTVALRSGTIAFEYAYPPDVFAASADGENVGILHATESADHEAEWSPDGSRLAYISSSQLWIKEVGKPPTRITDMPGGVRRPHWSPDGMRLVVADGSNANLHVLNRNGTGTRVLTSALPGPRAYPAWSPDGATIAFVIRGPSATELFRIPAGGGTPVYVRLQVGGVTVVPYEDRPAWSPDGSKLAFYGSPATGGSYLYLMNPSANEPVPIIAASHGGTPQWSPDGQWVAFSDGVASVYVTSLDGTTTNRVTSGYNPTWSPNGLALAFVPPNDYHVRITDMAGTWVSRLTMLGSYELRPRWRPVP